MSRTRAIAVAIGLVVLATPATAANAASTRAEYVAQVDPICQAGQAQERAAFKAYVKSAKRYLRRHPNSDPDKPSKQIFRLVTRLYSRILAIDRSVLAQLNSIPPAAGDEAAVAEWLGVRTQSADLLERSIHALQRQKLKLFFRLYLKSIRRSLQATLPISDFGFRYCDEPPGIV
jgi:hypothetical protein